MHAKRTEDDGNGASVSESVVSFRLFQRRPPPFSRFTEKGVARLWDTVVNTSGAARG